MKNILTNRILFPLLLMGISFFASSCNIFFPKKEDKTLLTLASIYKYQRPYGVYISGKLIDASNNALANTSVTITGRGENATVVRATTSTSPAGYYANVLSAKTSGASNVAATAPTYSNGTPSTWVGTTNICDGFGSGAVGSSAVVCDISTLPDGAAAVGISTTVQTSGTVVANFTTDSSGKFYTAFTIPTTGNTLNITVNGLSKRLRISKSGTAGLLSSSDRSITNGTAISGEGTFNVDSLVFELEYPRNLIQLEGTLSKDEEIPSGFSVLLTGTVVVPNNVTLTINSGVTLYGSVSPGGALLVKPGGKLIARGTVNSPIVFTSEKGQGLRQPGDWQGVILQGSGCQTFGGRCAVAVGEGDVGTFGGSDNSGTCGTMQYVRIEFAGAPFSPGNERNGLSLMGCGSGTSIQYVQVHRSYDDAFEVWGGAPQFKYVVSSSARDDNFDFADGTVLKMQYGIVFMDADAIRSNDDTSRCIEGDGNTAQTCSGSARSGGTCSDVYFANITCVGPTSTTTNLGSSIFLRRAGTNIPIGDFGNFHVVGTTAAIECPSSQPAGGRFGAVNTIYRRQITGSDATNNGCTASINSAVSVTSTSTSSPDFAPVSSTSIGTSLKSNNSNFNDAFFDDTSYYGAAQFGGTRWWDGWTSFPLN